MTSSLRWGHWRCRRNPHCGRQAFTERLTVIAAPLARRTCRVAAFARLLARDPAGEFKPQAFLCTDQDAAPADILAWFVRRWAIKVAFGEARRHLGVET